jgi:hypothetical protein
VVGPANDVSCANDMALYQGMDFSGRARQRCQLCKRYGFVSGHGLQWSASPTMSAVQTIWLCVRVRASVVGLANDVSCANDMALYQGTGFSGRARRRRQLCKRYGFVSGYGLQWSASPTMSAVQTIWPCIRARTSVVGLANDVSCANDMALYQGTASAGPYWAADEGFSPWGFAFLLGADPFAEPLSS